MTENERSVLLLLICVAILAGIAMSRILGC